MRFLETASWPTGPQREIAVASFRITPPIKFVTFTDVTNQYNELNVYTTIGSNGIPFATRQPRGQDLFGLNVGSGTFTWIAPPGIFSVCVVAVGGGGGGGRTWSSGGGGGGGLGWKNNIPVVPGQSYTVTVGVSGSPQPNATNNGTQGGNSFFISLATVAGYGSGQGGPGAVAASPAYGGGFIGDGGGRGGDGGVDGNWVRSGAGAGGYTGNGGDTNTTGTGGSAPAGGGGAAAGAYSSTFGTPAGGGVGLLGQGPSGLAQGTSLGGQGGSGGQNGSNGEPFTTVLNQINGGAYGGGGGGSGTTRGGGFGGQGGVRIIYGDDRAFPSTNTADVTPLILATIL